jgi:hypothetical protein
MKELFHFHLIDRKHFEDEAVKGVSPIGIGVCLGTRKPLTAEVQNVILKMMEMPFRFLHNLVAIFKNSICHFSAEPIQNYIIIFLF